MINHCLKPRTVAAAGMLLILSSCHSAPTRLFGLAAVAPTSISSSYAGPPIHVEAIHVPPALDRIEIPSEVAPDEFKVSDVDHWIAPLGQITRQVLTADLAARLPEGLVIFPHLARPVAAIGVNVDLLAFSAGREGARLQVSWVGTSGGSQGQSCGGTMVLNTARPVSGSASMAGALSALLAQLADGIVAQLLLLPPAEPVVGE
jgi:uncharacterized protein